MSAWATDWRTAPSSPRSLNAKTPSVMSPICAIDEYATIPRRSGERNASTRAVDEPRAREDEDEAREVVGRFGELRQADAQEAVDRRLRDDRREHRGDLDGRLAVRERKPAVEREERRLDRERDREAQEDPDVVARPRVGQRERALRDAERHDRREHEQRARHRVDDERQRRGVPPLAAPDADEDVERDEHRLERDVEEEEVLRGERRDDRARAGRASARGRHAAGRGRPRARSRSPPRRRPRSRRRARSRSRRSRPSTRSRGSRPTRATFRAAARPSSKS